MQPHEEEAVAELKWFTERGEKLDLFLHSPTFQGLDSDERFRLRMQSRLMESCIVLLRERIDHFPKADSAGS
jgi:hypothetical protein